MRLRGSIYNATVDMNLSMLCYLCREISSLQHQLSNAESKVAMLEAELSVYSTKSTIATEKESTVKEDKENVSTVGLEALTDPLKVMNRAEESSLLQRYKASQETLRQMRLNCDALSVELTASNSKLQLALRQLEVEKTRHAEVMAQRDEIEVKLHSRIGELMRDRASQLDSNDALSAELKQLKEYNERIKREHLRQLEALDKVCWPKLVVI